MKKIKLIRFCDSSIMGVFGELLLNGRFIAFTMEQPWADNKPFVSCVPAGVYKLRAVNSPKYGKTFALVNPSLKVYASAGEMSEKDDRYACLFVHSANETTELKGCVAAGLSLGHIDSDGDGVSHWALVSSSKAVSKVLDLCEDGDEVEIVWKEH